MAEFKKISDTEVVEAPAENDNLLLVSEGVVKQVPVTAVGGGGGGADPILLTYPNGTVENLSEWLPDYRLSDGSEPTNDLYAKFVAGTPILVTVETNYGPLTIRCCGASMDSSGAYVYLFFLNPVGNNMMLCISND